MKVWGQRNVRISLLGVLVLLAMLATTGVGLANMANPYQEGDQVGEPTGDLRSVAIEHESLVMNLAPLADDAPAQVTAAYDVRNSGSLKRLNLVFVAAALASSQAAGTGVWLDGQAVSWSIRPTDLPPFWQPPKTTPGIESNSNLPYRVVRGTRSGILFSLALAPGRHQIRVAYNARASAVSTQQSPVRYWQLGYVLAPARNWQSFGKLDFEVDVPPAWELASSVPLQRSGDTFHGSFNGIPADTIGLTTQAPVPPQPLNFDLVPFAFVVGLALSVGIGTVLGRLLRAHGRPCLWALPVAVLLAIGWSIVILASSQIANSAPVAPPLQRAWTYGYGAAQSHAAETLGLAALAFPVVLILTQVSAFLVRRYGSKAAVSTSRIDADP